MTAISAIDLTKKYKNKTAVNALNMSLEQGELFALLGVNGAGKSTTIKMLSCLTKPTSGDAILLGDSVVKDPARVKNHISVSPQETAIAPNLTVKENLELIAGIYGSGRRLCEKKAEEMIESFGMSDIARSRAKKLSGGWQRCLGIAMALIPEPSILFLDEPTLGLDVLARRGLWKMIEQLKGRVTMILTTHYLEEAEALSDRIGIMTHGELKAVGTAQELIKRANADDFEDVFIYFAGEEGKVQ